MDLKEVMALERFVVVGDTLNHEKYAAKIKTQLLEKGYTVSAVGKELPSINEVSGDIDVIDMCIHPAKGIGLLKECTKSCKCVVLQPGAESDDIKAYVTAQGITWLEGCLLVGLRLYPKNKA